MPNALDTSPSQRTSILAIGEMGAGKTSQFLTLPGKKFIYLFDPNAIASLQGYNVDYEEFIPESIDLDLSIKTLKKDVGDKPQHRRRSEPMTYRNWEADFEKRLESNFFKDYDWVGLDSFTTFTDVVMDRVQYLNGRLGKHPEQADYTALINTQKNVMRALFGTGCNVYATAHHELRQDELSQRIHYQLVMTGRLRTQIPLLFTEVLVLSVARGKEGANYQIQTRPDRENPKVRSTLKEADQYLDVTIDWSKDPIRQGIAKHLNL